MQKNLDKLRKLVFPDEEISVNKYPNNGGYSPMLYNPNLVYLTINGLYDNLFGIVDNLSINIDEGTPWETANIFDDKFDKKSKGAEIYPSIINVSMGMKIIENPNINSTDNKYEYVYTFSKGQKYKGSIKVDSPITIDKNGLM
jgi:hypothetical protein